MANGPALPPSDDKVGAEIQADDNVDVGGGFGLVRLDWRVESVASFRLALLVRI